MSEPAPLFSDLQTSARRRTAALLAGSFVLLWVSATIVTFFWHVGDANCRPDGFGGQTCDTVIRPSPIALVVTAIGVAVYLVIAYLASGRAALALAGARRADGPQYAQLRNIVEEMSIASGTPVPDVYVVDDPSPNAFATGRRPDHAAVTVTTGLLQQLSRRELTGVVAHEVAHIRNRDISVTTIAVLTAGTIAVLADIAMRFAWVIAASGGRGRGRNSSGSAGIAVVAIAIAFALYVFALPAALLLRAALSRQRESLADASAVQYTRDPSGIRSALEKLEADGTSPTRVSTATAHLWIDEPKPASSVQRGMLSGMFDTHPPMAERIAILRRMEGLPPDERGPNDPRPVPRAASGGGPLPPPGTGGFPFPYPTTGSGPGEHRGDGPMWGPPGQTPR